MSVPYIPPREVDLVNWADNFATLITAAPATYGLAAGDATIIQGLVNAWDAAYAAGTDPGTRTPVTVAAKNTAKLAMLPVVRTYASQIRLNPGVANSDKLNLGLNLPNNSPSPIPTPSTQPVVIVMQAINLRHILKFRDETASPTSRAKAPGSIGLELWRGIGTTPIVDPALCTYIGTFVKVPFNSDFDAGDAGKIATYFGRWVTRAGSVGYNQALQGPWSNAVSFGIVGGG